MTVVNVNGVEGELIGDFIGTEGGILISITPECYDRLKDILCHDLTISGFATFSEVILRSLNGEV